MNILAMIFSALQSNFGSQALLLVSEIPSFIVQSILSLTGDVQTNFHSAMVAIITDIKNGKDWEQALTDGYNIFYSGEITSLDKLAMAALEWLAKTVGAIPQ